MTLRARRRFDVQQFLDRHAVAQAVGDRGDVVHAVHVGRELLVGAVLGDLLDAAVQVADDAFGAEHLFAVQLQDHAQHAVRGRVLRPHVENKFVGVENRRFQAAGNACRAHGLLSALDPQVFLHPGVVLLQDVVVLAQREALPLVRQQDALQVGMAGELDAEHVVDFALQPVGRGPDAHHARRRIRRRRPAP